MSDVTVRFETEDPVDALSRVLRIVEKNAIPLQGVRLSPCGDIGFTLQLDLGGPLPMRLENLLDRLRCIPAVLPMSCCVEPKGRAKGDVPETHLRAS